MSGTHLPEIVLVGYGNIGSAMLSGWLSTEVQHVAVVRRQEVKQPCYGPNVSFYNHPDQIPSELAPAAIVFAIKPQQAGEILPDYSEFARRGSLMVSLMAGKSVSAIEAILGAGASIVRAMPNTPAALRRGFTVAYAGKNVTLAQKHLCGQLLAAVGDVAWAEDERALDPVTAISGGGPAYVFLLAELLEAAGVEQNLPRSLARRMARQTIIGAASLLAASDTDAAQLRRNVTSAGGTTERALQVLMAQAAWPQSVSDAIAVATARSRTLADDLE